MNYTDAPACEMLATHCAICNRPLLDSVSVETGIGPVCRKNIGFEEIDAAQDGRREQANRITNAVARHAMPAEEAVAALKALGFDNVAAKIAERLAEIRIYTEAGMMVVESPYNAAAIPAFRSVKGRRWNGSVNTFPITQLAKRQVWRVLQDHYSGFLGLSEKGLFRIPA